MLNSWTISEVNRAESTWGQKVPGYSADMFNFAIENVVSWLDLGCGFGRFLKYLINYTGQHNHNYIGYDSSPSMIERITNNFPNLSDKFFRRPITDKILHMQESVLCSAVMIHLPLQDQEIILKNVKEINPLKFTFDINSPAESYLSRGGADFERHIKGAEGAFRMTWQSHYRMTAKILYMFKDYKLSISFYDLKSERNKVVYFLERAGR
jgi:SAM-dependent methyltransferase